VKDAWLPASLLTLFRWPSLDQAILRLKVIFENQQQLVAVLMIDEIVKTL
jgi:hypothetical protein